MRTHISVHRLPDVFSTIWYIHIEDRSANYSSSSRLYLFYTSVPSGRYIYFFVGFVFEMKRIKTCLRAMCGVASSISPPLLHVMRSIPSCKPRVLDSLLLSSSLAPQHIHKSGECAELCLSHACIVTVDVLPDSLLFLSLSLSDCATPIRYVHAWR